MLTAIAARWAAFTWPAAWDGLVVGLLVLALLPAMRWASRGFASRSSASAC